VSPLKSAITAGSRRSSFEETWSDRVGIAIARPSENVYNPISQNT
jgi:hypothetical protein